MWNTVDIHDCTARIIPSSMTNRSVGSRGTIINYNNTKITLCFSDRSPIADEAVYLDDRRRHYVATSDPHKECATLRSLQVNALGAWNTRRNTNARRRE